MKKIRLWSLLLAMTMLLGSVSAFAAEPIWTHYEPQIEAVEISAAMGIMEANAELTTDSDDILLIRLLEHGWIEILWKNNMLHENDNAILTTPANFDVRYNGEKLVLGQLRYWTPGIGTTAQTRALYANASGTIYMSTMQILNWEEVANNYNYDTDPIFEPAIISGHDVMVWNGTQIETGLTFQVLGDLPYRNGSGAADKGIVYDIPFEPYYKKIVNYDGFLLKFSGAVTDANINTSVNNFKNTWNVMFAKDADEALGLAEKIAEWKMAGVFSGTGENLHFCPHYRNSISYNVISGISSGYGAGPGTYPCVGFGGTASIGTLVHELMHCIDYLALRFLPQHEDWMNKFGAVYADVVEQDMFRHNLVTGASISTFNYGLQNSGEFLATLATVWFQSISQNNQTPTGREALKSYYYDLWELFDRIFYPTNAPGITATGSTARIPFVKTFLPNKNLAGEIDTTISYTFGDRYVDANGVRQSSPVYSGHYFSIINSMDSHLVRSMVLGQQLTTWWDTSHTSYNYNFSGMSWIVTPIEIDGEIYYHFTTKGNNPLQTTNSNISDAYGDPASGIPGVFLSGNNYQAADDTYIVTALGVLPEENVVGGAIRSVARDMEDENQLWSLVTITGRVSMLVNKASGLTLSTLGGVLPGDGTELVLIETSPNPPSGAMFSVRQLKPFPYGGTASSLVADRFRILPTPWYINLAKVWIDKSDSSVIWLEWPEKMPNDIAGDAANYIITDHRGMASEKLFEIDAAGTYHRGNITRIQLVEPMTEAQIAGGIKNTLGQDNGSPALLRLQFAGNMVGLESGLIANNGYGYYFKGEDYETPVILFSSEVSASVEKLNGNKNNLTITVTEVWSNGAIITITKVFSVDNNLAGIFQVGAYEVYAQIQGNKLVALDIVAVNEEEQAPLAPPSITAEATVTKKSGNLNTLTIFVTVEYPHGGGIAIFMETFDVANNAVGIYKVDAYDVYVEIKGNDQIRACYIVE